MTVSEAARKNLQELKGKPFKQQLEHIISYYGVSILVFAIFLAVGIGYLIHIITLKEEVLNVSCIGPVSVQAGTEDYTRDFAQFAGIDLDRYEVDISTNLSTANQTNGSYESVELLTTLVASKAVDVVAADVDYLMDQMYQNLFADLTGILSPEQLETYQDSFLYIDMSVVREIKNMTLPEDVPEYPDPTKPEDMKEPVAVAIRLSDSVSFVNQFFLKNEGDTAIAFAVNTKNLENALLFLDYIHQ